MSEAVFTAATVGGNQFGIPSYSGVLNYFTPSGSVERTEYYICVNNDPAVLTAGPIASNSNWKLVAEVKVDYDVDGNAEKIWRSK